MKIHLHSRRNQNFPSTSTLLNSIETDIICICNDQQSQVSYENIYTNIYLYYLHYCSNNTVDFNNNMEMLCNILDKVNIHQRHIPMLRDCFIYPLKHEKGKTSGECPLTNKFLQLENVKIIKLND
jgi:hypothetical protein